MFNHILYTYIHHHHRRIVFFFFSESHENSHLIVISTSSQITISCLTAFCGGNDIINTRQFYCNPHKTKRKKLKSVSFDDKNQPLGQKSPKSWRNTQSRSTLQIILAKNCLHRPERLSEWHLKWLITVFFSVFLQLDALDVSTTFSTGACPQERDQGHR